MRQTSKRILLTIGGILLILVVGIIGFAWHLLNQFDEALNAHQYPHKTDAEMIRNFNEHRSDFERVRSMVEADSTISRIDENWTLPDNIDGNKVAEYRELFARIGTPRGLNKRPGSSNVDLIASSLGWVASGSMKGYTYAAKKPTNGYFVDSLDDTEALSSQARYLRRIDDNWYLFFER